MIEMASAPRRFVVVGGGCYGTHYAQALARAMDRGECAEREIWIVDRDVDCAAARLPERPDRRVIVRDWDDFLREHLSGWRQERVRGEADCLVPAPLTPHLFVRWMVRELSSELEVQEIEPPFLPETPFARATGPRLVVSFAEWRCPMHCVEPYVCPATRQVKGWDVARELSSYVRSLRATGLGPVNEPMLARVTHRVEGVGGFPLRDWARAARSIRAALLGPRARRCVYALAATVSSCHGAASLLRVERREATAPASREPARGKVPEPAPAPSTPRT